MNYSCVAILFSLHCATVAESVVSETSIPWEKHNFDFESGIAWQRSSNTPLPYRLVPSQISWRSPYHLKYDFGNESKIVLRSQVSLIGTWVENGPENHYFGFSSAPSIEWWSPNDKWSIYASIGGGLGFIDSTDVVGGQGQDKTLNWFAKSGLRYQLDESVGIFGGVFFQHLSNGGETEPNPGIDALGFTLGMSYSF